MTSVFLSFIITINHLNRGGSLNFLIELKIKQFDYRLNTYHLIDWARQCLLACLESYREKAVTGHCELPGTQLPSPLKPSIANLSSNQDMTDHKNLLPGFR